MTTIITSRSRNSREDAEIVEARSRTASSTSDIRGRVRVIGPDSFASTLTSRLRNELVGREGCLPWMVGVTNATKGQLLNETAPAEIFTGVKSTRGHRILGIRGAPHPAQSNRLRNPQSSKIHAIHSMPQHPLFTPNPRQVLRLVEGVETQGCSALESHAQAKCEDSNFDGNEFDRCVRYRRRGDIHHVLVVHGEFSWSFGWVGGCSIVGKTSAVVTPFGRSSSGGSVKSG